MEPPEDHLHVPQQHHDEVECVEEEFFKEGRPHKVLPLPIDEDLYEGAPKDPIVLCPLCRRNDHMEGGAIASALVRVAKMIAITARERLEWNAKRLRERERHGGKVAQRCA